MPVSARTHRYPTVLTASLDHHCCCAVGDRKEEGASTGRQYLLDVPRARWYRYDAMRDYFNTFVQALVDEGIAKWNTKCAHATCACTCCAVTLASDIRVSDRDRYDENGCEMGG